MYQLLSALLEKRESIIATKEEYERRMKEFELSNAELIKDLSDKRLEVDQLEIDIRAAALQEYKETGKKTLAGGVGIRVVSKMNYADVDALDWAKKHSLALSLDKKTFEAIAKAQPLPFVEYVEVPTATIPKEIVLQEAVPSTSEEGAQ